MYCIGMYRHKTLKNKGKETCSGLGNYSLSQLHERITVCITQNYCAEAYGSFLMIFVEKQFPGVHLGAKVKLMYTPVYSHTVTQISFLKSAQESENIGAAKFS